MSICMSPEGLLPPWARQGLVLFSSLHMYARSKSLPYFCLLLLPNGNRRTTCGSATPGRWATTRLVGSTRQTSPRAACHVVGTGRPSSWDQTIPQWCTRRPSAGACSSAANAGTTAEPCVPLNMIAPYLIRVLENCHVSNVFEPCQRRKCLPAARASTAGLYGMVVQQLDMVGQFVQTAMCIGLYYNQLATTAMPSTSPATDVRIIMHVTSDSAVLC